MGDRWPGARLPLLYLLAASLITPAAALAQLPAPDSIAPVDGETGDSSRERALSCLTTAIAYEAGYEPIEGQQAVAQVILNRARNPLFPKSVCGVVYAGSQRSTGCQFTFTCNGALRRRMSEAVMTNARLVAAAVLDGLVPDRVAGATHYHADYVLPYWAASLVRVVKIGAHIFYRLPSAANYGGLQTAYLPSGEPAIGAQASIERPAARAVSSLGAAVPQRFTLWGLDPHGVR